MTARRHCIAAKRQTWNLKKSASIPRVNVICLSTSRNDSIAHLQVQHLRRSVYYHQHYDILVYLTCRRNIMCMVLFAEVIGQNYQCHELLGKIDRLCPSLLWNMRSQLWYNYRTPWCVGADTTLHQSDVHVYVLRQDWTSQNETGDRADLESCARDREQPA